MSSTIRSRKRGGIDEEKVQTYTSTSFVNTNSNNDDGLVMTRTNKILVILATLLFAVTMLSPSRNNGLMNEKQLRVITDSIEKQKDVLSKTYGELTSKVHFDVESLGIVTKGKHEEELNKVKESHNNEKNSLKSQHKEDINKLKENHNVVEGKLQVELSEKTTLHLKHEEEEKKMKEKLKAELGRLQAELDNGNPLQGNYDDKSGCIDRHESCGYWAHDKECDKNPKYMAFYCMKSCNMCDKQQ